MNHLQDQAVAAMKRKDYDAALQHYNKAIGRAESTKLYDARAACHIKLNDLQSALNDAKKCIQVSKTDPLGYLRAGVVLIAMNKKSVALEVMAHGLRKVKHAGQSYETLQSTHNQLMEEIRPRNSIDPMTVLPRELAISILQELDFRHRVKVCSVSKAWSVFIKSVPELWEHLDFSKARPQTRFRVKHAFIVQAVKTARRSIKRATLNNMAKTEDAIELLVRHCPLESLSLLAIPRLSNNFAQMLQPALQLRSLHFPMDQEQTFSMMRLTLEVLGKQLEELSCRMSKTSLLSNLTADLSLPRMKTLNTVCLVGRTEHGLCSMPALRTLIIRSPPSPPYGLPSQLCQLQEFGQLQHIDIDIGQLEFCFLNLPITLKTLKVKCKMTTTEWPCLALPELEELNLEVAFDTHFSILSHSLLQGKPQKAHLRRLLVKSVMLPDKDTALQDFESFCHHPRLKDLRHIGWPQAIGWHDDFMPVMVKNFPHLSSIDLSSTSVTGVGVQAALEAPHLQELLLNDCRFLSHDAVQLARSRGIRVQNRTAEALSNERKIFN